MKFLSLLYLSASNIRCALSCKRLRFLCAATSFLAAEHKATLSIFFHNIFLFSNGLLLVVKIFSFLMFTLNMARLGGSIFLLLLLFCHVNVWLNEFQRKLEKTQILWKNLECSRKTQIFYFLLLFDFVYFLVFCVQKSSLNCLFTMVVIQ